MWSVNHVLFTLDLAVLVKTIVALILRDDISADGDAIMPPFMGEASQRFLLVSPNP